MIVFAEVAIGEGGILGCRRCGGSTQSRPRDVAEVETELDRLSCDWVFGPGPNVAFTGIEPLDHPRLPDLIGAASRLGFERIRLRTDAGALSLPTNAQGAVRAGVRHLEVILLAGDASAHDRIAGRPGLFDAAISGVSRFLAAAGESSAETFVSGYLPLCPHNLHEAANAVGALAGMGAAAVVIDATKILAPEDEHRRLVEAALHTATVNAMAASVIGIEPRFGAPYDRAPWTTEGAR